MLHEDWLHGIELFLGECMGQDRLLVLKIVSRSGKTTMEAWCESLIEWRFVDRRRGREDFPKSFIRIHGDCVWSNADQGTFDYLALIRRLFYDPAHHIYRGDHKEGCDEFQLIGGTHAIGRRAWQGKGLAPERVDERRWHI